MPSPAPLRAVPPRPLPARPRPERPPSLRVLPDRPITARPTTAPAPGRRRPDPNALRLAIGFTGVAAASAMATAFLSPVVASAPPPTTDTSAALVAPVQHITRYVQLQPGQTAPPQSTVQQLPAPTPRVVTITTRQSGVRP